ncbi:hypothetical protein EVAR_30396_1 [Eumeta japonica]|uniref:Uncharacterized protein n=1 Tax=Eumeta variegata TaxID=151549 RepID=A0A4C1W812_EUMVA|nr:hypothetical protein EVAR_30396_1 [Eumeta japonica]
MVVTKPESDKCKQVQRSYTILSFLIRSSRSLHVGRLNLAGIYTPTTLKRPTVGRTTAAFKTLTTPYAFDPYH